LDAVEHVAGDRFACGVGDALGEGGDLALVADGLESVEGRDAERVVAGDLHDAGAAVDDLLHLRGHVRGARRDADDVVVQAGLAHDRRSEGLDGLDRLGHVDEHERDLVDLFVLGDGDR
jgi:hypothetical protein